MTTLEIIVLAVLLGLWGTILVALVVSVKRRG